MIDGLKPYPAMKDSGVPWLGEVPEHWDVDPLGRSIRVKSGDMISADEERESGVPIYGGNGVRGYTFRANTFGPTILLGRVGAKCGCVHLVKGQFWASEHALRVILQTAIDLRFLALVLEHADLNRLAIRTAQPLINSTIVRTHRVALPPLPEQAAIVRFLDHADRRIRRYIRAKQKLIKLLEEQKQAIIHRAVTRGLDPNVRLKPSGVEWLGDVPEHWEVKKIRQCGAISGGLTPSMADRSLWDGDVPWVTPKDMKRFTIAGASMTVSARALEATSLKLIPAGSVLLVVRGMILARRVPIARTTEHVTINQDMKALVPGAGIDAGFLAYRMDAAQAAFVPMIDEAGHGTKRFPTERWKDVVLAIPPADEQSQIVRHLDQATAHVADALDNARHETDLLREYRTRLIADVITGKLDVRKAAARLPDEAEEPEPLDEIEGEGDTDAVPEEAEA